ncbi:MAG: hypothetical protein O3C21_12400 [Verrucomicrobia bacterium]|nr:hypothetical protein [Verrucomicrobiota bacterium]
MKVIAMAMIRAKGGVVGVLAFLVFGANVRAEERTFTNLEGKEIKAELISATETEVTIKLATGREYSIALDKLIAADQEYIRSWRAAKPADAAADADAEAEAEAEAVPDVDGSGSEASDPKPEAEAEAEAKVEGPAISKLELDYRFVKKKTGSKKLGKGQDVETWIYEVELTNKSRVAVPQVTIKYEMFINYDSKYAEKKRGLSHTVEGEYVLKSLPGQGRINFKTAGVPVLTDKSRTLKGDIVTIVQYEEELAGIILNFYQGENKVGTQAYGRTKRD